MWNTFDKELLKDQYKVNRWDETRGLPLEKLEEGCQEIQTRLAGQSTQWIKSEMLVYLLEHMQFEVNPNEFFQNKLNRGNFTWELLWKNQEICREPALEGVWSSFQQVCDCTSMEASMDFGHLAPDWKFVLTAGIPGIVNRLEEYAGQTQDPGKLEFYRCGQNVWLAIATLLRRMAESAKAIGGEKMEFVAANMLHLAEHAPETLAQAMELMLLVYEIQTQMDNANVRSLGGLDRMFHPFYRKDLDSGRFTEAQLRELIRDFLFKISTMAVTANTPFYLAGRYLDGTDASNELSCVLMEEYRTLDIVDPKIHVMYHPEMSPKLLQLLLKMIQEGHNSICFINVDMVEKCLQRIGVSEEDSKKVIVYGCYEPASEAEEIPATCGGKLNLPKIVELAIFGGVDPVSGKQIGPDTGLEFENFEAFYQAVERQIAYAAEASMKTISAWEKWYHKICPAPVLSATYHSCVEKGLDIFAGGAKYNNTSIVAAGLATAADSLLAVQKAVFEEKRVTLQRLREILLSNWDLDPGLRSQCVHRYPKFGNNCPEVDRFGRELCLMAGNCINGKPNGRGGVFRMGMFTVDWRYYMGKRVGATPDGRGSGEPFSKNFCAVIGQDKKGVTSFLNTVLSVDAEQLPGGSVADVVLHSSATQGEDGLMALEGLLKAYMLRKGFAIQFNVLNPEVLRNAQREPDKYKNLQVRLCGWNVFFVDLRKEEQDEFILRSAQQE